MKKLLVVGLLLMGVQLHGIAVKNETFETININLSPSAGDKTPVPGGAIPGRSYDEFNTRGARKVTVKITYPDGSSDRMQDIDAYMSFRVFKDNNGEYRSE